MRPKTKNSLALLGCLFLLYISWGSSFIGNKIALQYFPGIMLSALRMIVAGAILLSYTYIRREKSNITWEDIKRNAVLAIFLVLISSGFLSKGQESVPSGTTAMFFGAVPMWMMLAGWLLWGERRPTIKQFTGLLIGLIALLWLNIHQGLEGETSLVGVALIICSSLAWVYGSHISKSYSVNTSQSIIRSTGLLMWIGGLETLVFSLLIGERLDVSLLNTDALLAFSYLVIMASIIGYTSYLWLLYHARPIIAISYEYVNPVIAIYLGWLLAGETIDPTTVAACTLLVSSVFLVVSHGKD